MEGLGCPTPLSILSVASIPRAGPGRCPAGVCGPRCHGGQLRALSTSPGCPGPGEPPGLRCAARLLSRARAGAAAAPSPGPAWCERSCPAWGRAELPVPRHGGERPSLSEPRRAHAGRPARPRGAAGQGVPGPAVCGQPGGTAPPCPALCFAPCLLPLPGPGGAGAAPPPWNPSPAVSEGAERARLGRRVKGCGLTPLCTYAQGAVKRCQAGAGHCWGLLKHGRIEHPVIGLKIRGSLSHVCLTPCM